MQKRELLAAAAVFAAGGALLTGYYYFSLSPSRGLRVRSPDFAAIAAHKTPAPPPGNLARINPDSFMAFFGLKMSAAPLPASSPAVISKPEQPPAASETIDIPRGPVVVDLAKLGYRLNGIAMENGRSAAFIFVPSEKRTLVIRENASSAFRLIEVGMRSIKLQTPEGIGVLNLQNAKVSPAGAPGPQGSSSNYGYSASSNSSGTTANSVAANGKSQAAAQPQSVSGADSIASLVNQGQLRVTEQRGRFFVEVRQVPELFKGYDLKQGDRIIGTNAGDFGQARDVAINLGAVQTRTAELKVSRNGRIITLQPPPPESKNENRPR